MKIYRCAAVSTPACQIMFDIMHAHTQKTPEHTTCAKRHVYMIMITLLVATRKVVSRIYLFCNELTTHVAIVVVAAVWPNTSPLRFICIKQNMHYTQHTAADTQKLNVRMPHASVFDDRT